MAKNIQQVSTLRQKFDMVVAEYVTAMLSRFEWNAHNGFWVADDCTGTYIYDGYAISLFDLIYIVDNEVAKKDFVEWWDYTTFACENKLNCPNLDSWIKGCPRMSKQERKKFPKLKKELDNLIAQHKRKY